jgi:hypothetical protein
LKEVADHRETVSEKYRLRWATTHYTESLIGIGDKFYVDATSRERIVRDLYPRLLYTFSDVVCYITNNPRLVLILPAGTIVRSRR